MMAGFKGKMESLYARIATSPIREFLETSTLHGLVYISKAKSVLGKVLWAVSVVVSFCIASVLIYDSFADWSAQPVSTIISTHPIKDLKFPNWMS